MISNGRHCERGDNNPVNQATPELAGKASNPVIGAYVKHKGSQMAQITLQRFAYAAHV